ncbi:MAG TPA: hypothetical protein VFU81_03950, partial [Thermomicrobiales bacterium]|nr:hypothetical protein [Thermomicrobiales bacterium]
GGFGGYGGGFGGYGGGYYNPFGGYGYGYNPWSWFFGGSGYNPFGGYSSGYGYNPFGGFSSFYNYNFSPFSSWGFGASGRLGRLDVAASSGGGASSGAALAAASQAGASADLSHSGNPGASIVMTDDGETSSSPAAPAGAEGSLPADDSASISDALAFGEAETAAIDAFFNDEGLSSSGFPA